MKNKNLASFLEDLKKINITGKPAYAIAKNRKLIEAELEIFQETIKPSKEFNDYEQERVELAKKHAKKDEKGKEIIENNSYVLEDEKAFEEAFKTLKETHKEAIDTRSKQIEDFNTLMEEETKLELHKIEEADIPQSATAQDVYTLLALTK